MRELRPYQADAIQSIRETLRNGVRRMVVQGPCGFGKTLVAATIANGALAKGKRMAFVCPAISLIDQTVSAFYEEGCTDVGVLQADHHMTDLSKSIQVCSIQTVASRGFFPDADIVVFDEVHNFFKAHAAWMADPRFEKVPFIGLSATPWTKGLGKYFETLIVASTTKELIDQGYLSNFKVFSTGHPDLTGVRTVAGDYHEGELSEAMQKGTLTADIIKTWQERWGKDKTLCFAVDCAHAQALQQRFEQAGISCGYQDAHTPPEERREIKKKFYSGELRVVTSVGTLTTGVDWPVRCIVFARPTKSEMLFVQCIGRGLRTEPGKDHLILLDHSDTTARLGLVTDIHYDELHDGKPKSDSMAQKNQPPLPVDCPQCQMMRPRSKAPCPNCGFVPEVVSGVVERDGELVEVTAGERQKKGAKKVYSMAEKARFLAQLKAYALLHGRKEGWVSHSYRAKFDVWPDPSIRNVPPSGVIDAEVKSWVKSRNIAWAKSRKNQGIGARA